MTGGEVMSQAVPFLPRNPVLDTVSLSADTGFGEPANKTHTLC
jgi:hypothetical protein